MAGPVTLAAGIGWGMQAAGWIASPIVLQLVKKASPYLGSGVSKRLKGLETKILLLERVMEVVEESPHRDRLQQLFEDLKSAFYEAEEILDDIEYQHLKKNNDSEMKASKRTWLKKKLPSPTLSSLVKDKESGLSKLKLQKSLEKLEKVINDACGILEQLNLSSNQSHHIAASARGSVTTSTPPLRVIGRDKDCDMIAAMLHEAQEDGQRYSVVGIHGIGGSGKSTLAQLVCDREKNDMQEKKDGHFDLVMWVHVPQNFSVSTIFKMMFNAATETSCPELDNLDTVEVILKKELQGKRFLLVLDDVWYSGGDVVQYEKLQKILAPMKAGESGSKILVTSRTKDALIALGAAEQRRIAISDLHEDVFLKLFMHYALPAEPLDDGVRRTLEDVGKEIAKKLKGSPLAARTVGGQLRTRASVTFWRSVRDKDILNDTMGALWWSYQHLDEHARRCFIYCSIFPRGRSLEQHELVRVWAASGFAGSTIEGEDMEDVCQGYLDDLVSASFLQPVVLHLKFTKAHYYTVHDLLFDLAEKVAGSDHLRIENLGEFKKDASVDFTVDVPPGVRHIYVETYDESLIAEKICKLKNLRTLIIDSAWSPVEEKVLDIVFQRLKKLRVLFIPISGHDGQKMVPVPASVGQLRHLRFLVFLAARSIRQKKMLVLPATLSKLYHMQVLNFGYVPVSVTSCEDMCNLINLRHLINSGDLEIRNIGRLASVRTIGLFRVRKEEGYRLKELMNLKKLGGQLKIRGIENVESKAEALEAGLADKERLTTLELHWDGEASAEIQTEVLEGLCPPKHLERLMIHSYKGLRYPSWMAGEHNRGPKYLENIIFDGCRQELGPELGLFGGHLTTITIGDCSWVSLPDCINLTSLRQLYVFDCPNLQSPLPTLPQSLKVLTLGVNDALMSLCLTVGDPNWEKIRHINFARIGGTFMLKGVVKVIENP